MQLAGNSVNTPACHDLSYAIYTSQILKRHIIAARNGLLCLLILVASSYYHANSLARATWTENTHFVE